MNHSGIYFICLVSLGASSILVSKSSSRQLAFCCGDVANKCAVGCAGKDCSIQCSGTCGIFSSTCSYTCSSVTNACTSSSATTTEAASTAAATDSVAASTTAAAMTSAAATTSVATSTRAANCLASGALCLSITEGSKGSCGAGDCSAFVTNVGYNCS